MGTRYRSIPVEANFFFNVCFLFVTQASPNENVGVTKTAQYAHVKPMDRI